MKRRGIYVAIIGLLTAAPLYPLHGQEERFGGQMEAFDELWGQIPYQYNPVTLRPSGQPVIPVFEGWYPNEDGTFGLSFSYLNLNTEEAFHIPLGPDNFIEPREFDGMQPTYFMPAPPEGRERQQRNQRHQSVFSVRVPADFGNQDVVWTLRFNGNPLWVPGRITREAYAVENLEATTNGPEAAAVRLLDQMGPEARGRSEVIAGPMSATVGQPVRLSAWVDPLSREGALVYWFEHKGPADVEFNPPMSEVGEGGGEVTTMATFEEPGEYMIRVTAIETLAALVQHCCWTNAYVEVTVGR